MPIYNTKIPQNLTKILPIYYNNGKYIDNIQNKKIINHMQQSKTKLNKTYHPYKNTCIPLNQYSTQTYSNKNSIRTTSTYHNHTFNSSRNSGDRFTDRKEYNQNVLSHSNNYIKQQLLDDIDNQQYQADNQTLSLQQTQLEKITQLVTNLVIKNKLNSKNAFEVPLIDVSQLGIIKKNDENSWNKISNVLENSSKVYGFRVDFVVESINKMTNNIVRSQKMEKIQLTGVQQNKKGKQLAKQDNQINIINSNQYPSLVQVQQEQYYGNTQKPQKINQSFSQFRNDTNYQNVRRMFDQNGITGLLLARLAITNRLNLVVDNSIQYQPIKGGNTENNFVKEEIMSQKKQQIMRKFNIFQEIGMFKYYCFDREQSKDKKEQIMEECYNLCFDDMPEIFRNQDFRENEQYYIETFRDQNQFIEAPQQIKQLMDGKILQKIQINKNSCSNDLMNLFLEPFDQKNQRITNKKQKKQKNEAQPIKKPRKKRKVKNSDHHINFQADLQQNDKSTILSIAAKSDTSRARKTKQKNILKTLVPSFQIQKQMICLPLGQSNKQQIKLQDIQQNSKQFKQFLSGYKDKAEYSQNQFSDFLFSQSGLTERSLFLPMPNIKATKGWLWQQISPLRQIFLSQLHQKYQKQKGPVNEAIIFLSVLHLGNEKNLQISQTHGYEIRIKNYNPIFIQHNEFSHCN